MHTVVRNRAYCAQLAAATQPLRLSTGMALAARQLMSFVGLVPGERSSGSKRRQTGITKTGNAHVRRVLVEAAWSYRFPARKTAVLLRRAERALRQLYRPSPGRRRNGCAAAIDT